MPSLAHGVARELSRYRNTCTNHRSEKGKAQAFEQCDTSFEAGTSPEHSSRRCTDAGGQCADRCTGHSSDSAARRYDTQAKQQAGNNAFKDRSEFLTSSFQNFGGRVTLCDFDRLAKGGRRAGPPGAVSVRAALSMFQAPAPRQRCVCGIASSDQVCRPQCWERINHSNNHLPANHRGERGRAFT